MELRIQGKNLEVDQETRDYISRKVDRLSRHLAGISVAKIELAREKTRAQGNRVVAQVTLDVNGAVLRGEESGPNATAALDSVIDVLDRRVEKYKGKVYRSKLIRKSGKKVSIRKMDPTVPDEDSADEQILSAEGRVVRVKRFPIKPMKVDEAAFQMELLGHDFFMFCNSETDQHNVLYRRHDGDLGLIQPEPL